LNSPGSKR